MKLIFKLIICGSFFFTCYALPIKMNAPLPPTSNIARSVDEDFLIQNQHKKNVITLKDGLQYKILIEGHGPKPSANDLVIVHYAGHLINGKEFDSSYKRGQPALFLVKEVIPGWSEALQLMTVGSTWELYIPAALAYGKEGAPPVIGANKTLIFTVQLLGIKKQASG